MNTVIVANGGISDQRAAADLLASAELIIAADGGTHHCLKLDYLPHLVIGDFDSLDPSTLEDLRKQEVELLEHPRRKDATDLELALLEAKERGATALSILGAVGGRWDQSLANFHLIASSRWQGMKVEVVDGPQKLLPIHPDRPLELHGEPGDLVSLIPLGGDAEGVHTSGLEYPLDGERLS
ncbi:MAG: thiamine diphosphokinase, partial [Anaerolineales bacterium]